MSCENCGEEIGCGMNPDDCYELRGNLCEENHEVRCSACKCEKPGCGGRVYAPRCESVSERCGRLVCQKCGVDGYCNQHEKMIPGYWKIENGERE